MLGHRGDRKQLFDESTGTFPKPGCGAEGAQHLHVGRGSCTVLQPSGFHSLALVPSGAPLSTLMPFHLRLPSCTTWACVECGEGKRGANGLHGQPRHRSCVRSLCRGRSWAFWHRFSAPPLQNIDPVFILPRVPPQP